MIVPAASGLRFNGIQALRAIAVLLVIWTHTKFTANFESTPFINNHYGIIGVDIFFVISGFVISLSASSLKFNGPQFFINRITRVAPIYWATAIPLIAMYLLKGKTSFESVSSTFTFLPIFDVGTYHEPTNAFAWTLAYEFWFYTTSAVAMSFFAEKWWKVIFVFFLVGTLLVHMFYHGAWLLPYILFNPFFLEFFFGILIFRYVHLLGLKILIVSVVGCLLMIGVMSLHIEVGDYMLSAEGGLRRALLMGGLGVFLVMGFISAERIGFYKWPAFALLLGECSYAIYLVQPYGLSFAVMVGKRLGSNHWLSAAVFLVCSICLGIIVNRLWERRLTQAAKRFMTRIFLRPA